MAEFTREDLRDLITDLRSDMRNGFDGVHNRLDILNGRTRKNEEVLARHDVRIDQTSVKCDDMLTASNAKWYISAAGGGVALILTLLGLMGKL